MLIEHYNNQIKKDLLYCIWSLKLGNIKRYKHQPYWEDETIADNFAEKIVGARYFENVAAHSWHVADCVLYLSARFQYIDVERALKIAILHDKLEIYTGDKNPLGRSGTGDNAHAFNSKKILDKKTLELAVLEKHLRQLDNSYPPSYRDLYLDEINLISNEARLVKSVDKLQAIMYIYTSKHGNLKDEHLKFIIRQMHKSSQIFLPMRPYYKVMLLIFLEKVAKKRKISSEDLLSDIKGWFKIKSLFDEDPLDLLLDQNHNDDLVHISAVSNKNERLRKFFKKLENYPPAHSSLEAYRQISEAINNVEDDVFGKDYWFPLRHYPPQTKTNRMYPVATESFYTIEEYSKVTMLVSVNELVFISNDGAIEIQIKNKNDPFGEGKNFEIRTNNIIFVKNDSLGHNVWHFKNK